MKSCKNCRHSFVSPVPGVRSIYCHKLGRDFLGTTPCGHYSSYRLCIGFFSAVFVVVLIASTIATMLMLSLIN